jgi:hypothetical protein
MEAGQAYSVELLGICWGVALCGLADQMTEVLLT